MIFAGVKLHALQVQTQGSSRWRYVVERRFAIAVASRKDSLNRPTLLRSLLHTTKPTASSLSKLAYMAFIVNSDSVPCVGFAIEYKSSEALEHGEALASVKKKSARQTCTGWFACRSKVFQGRHRLATEKGCGLP